MFASNSLNKSIRLALAFGGASALAVTGTATAQENDEEEQVQEQRVERVQVVGSRIRTDAIDNATPIDVISAELATEQGINSLGELLRTATVASGSNQLTAAISVGAVTEGGTGAESISMRGLGANRTLVLLNGRRAGPAGTRGQVAAFDMNAIPISAVERVEIMKEGASSLYGSDAVAGVINIITKRGDESSINVNVNQPFESGGESYGINGTWGTTFDRGSFRIVADYKHQSELARGDREHFECRQRYLFDAASGERADPIDPRTGEFHCNDLPYGMWLWNAGAGNYTALINSFDYDGAHAAAGRAGYTPVNPGDIQTPEGWYPVGFDFESDGWLDASHPFQDLATMIPETTIWSIYTQGDYDLTHTTNAYFELMHSQRETKTNGYRQFWEPFIPAWFGIVPGWDGDVFLDPTTVTDHSGGTTTVDYTRAVIGVEGSIGFWNWDASFQRSLNRGEYFQKIILDDALVMASDALWGDPCVGEFSPISGRPCYEVPFFDPEYLRGNHTQGTKDFLFDSETGRTIYKQDTFDAYITGDVFDLPAGTVAIAAGVAYQTDQIQDTPGEMTRLGNSWGMTSAGITAGRSTTRAVYGEANVPLLRDLPFVEVLDFTASARYTDVNAYGSDTTYRASLNWRIGGGFQVRASQGTSFRAPALFELYLENQSSFFNQQSDPCFNWGAREDEGTLNPIVAQNCAAAGVPSDYANNFGSATAITGGGAGVLQAETSTSKGVGLVWTSSDNVWAASADYYEVEITNQVSNVGGVQILNLCYSSEDFENEPFCDQIDRNDGTEDGNWGINTVRGGYVNVARQFVRGADFRATFANDTPFGFVRVRLDHTVQLERSFKQFPDSTAVDPIGRVGNPKHSGTLNTSLSRDNWGFNYAIRYYEKTDNYDTYTNGNQTVYRGTDVFFRASAPTTVYHTASVNYRFSDFDVTAGIANIFDKKPPLVSPASGLRNVGNSALYSQFDNLGRRAFLNLNYSF
ncbi:MAG: TonB-dependent receptor [Idiomarina sp.]|nr:TonB-dependent receptor [Idiomarina sp.]